MSIRESDHLLTAERPRAPASGLKILMVTPMPPQPHAPGAIPLVLYAQLTGLALRHQVTLVTIIGTEPGERQAVERLQAVGYEVYGIPLVHSSVLNRWKRRWRLASTWLWGQYPWRTIWFWEPDVQHLLDRLLTEQRFDLIVVEDNAMGVYHYRTKTPCIFTEHEVRRARPVNWHMGSPADWLCWAFRETDWKRWQRYQPAVWRRFDRIQTFTDQDAKAIRVLVPELASRVRVNPFGIVLPAVVDPAKQDDHSVLFVGNFTHPPNVDAAIWLGREIMPLLRQLSPGVSLILIGIYPPAEILSLAADDIRVSGPVADIEPFFERAAVVVAPVRIGGGMRMKVLHAMAMGKAVVTSSRGAEGLMFDGEQPPLVIREDAQEFARAIADLLVDRRKRVELGRRARSFTETHFSAQAYARRIEGIYAEMKGGL